MTSVQVRVMLTELATRPRSAPVWEEHHRDPVLRPSECAVSSTSTVEELPAPIIPTPPLPPSPPPQTRTPAPTPTARTPMMSASSG